MDKFKKGDVLLVHKRMSNRCHVGAELTFHREDKNKITLILTKTDERRDKNALIIMTPRSLNTYCKLITVEDYEIY